MAGAAATAVKRDTARTAAKRIHRAAGAIRSRGRVVTIAVRGRSAMIVDHDPRATIAAQGLREAAADVDGSWVAGADAAVRAASANARRPTRLSIIRARPT